MIRYSTIGKETVIPLQPIQVSILSKIATEDGDEQTIEQELEGRFKERDDHWLLKYTEKPGTSEQVQTTVKAYEKEVTVIRQGEISYRQRYRPEEITTCVVTTPGGNMDMEVNTLDYSREQTGDGGLIRFTFRLRMGGENMGRYQLSIGWTEVPEAT